MSEHVVITDNYTWTNEHNNVTKTVLRRFQVSNTPGTAWKDGLAGIQEMIGLARARNERLRSYGGKWSLSDVAICNDSIHDSKPLTFFGTVGKSTIDGSPLYPDDPKQLPRRLFYFQSGAQINQINNALESRGLSLPTTGASNGQTIAGAVSTGTHGAALRIGAMQDYVRALHIVTSETEHIILQPASNPVVNSSFSDIFGAELISDDALFNAAVVSFGSFGVIHGILLETVSLYMLETYCVRLDEDDVQDAYPLMSVFNHGSTTNLTAFCGRFGFPQDTDPHHFDIIVNPHARTQNAYLRVMYRRAYKAAKLSPEPASGATRVGDDIVTLIGSIANSAGALVPVIVNTLFGTIATVQSGYTQTPRNIFGDSTMFRPKNGGASTELGVPAAQAAAAVRLITSVARQQEFAGLIGIRFLKNSAATLAFTRFAPLTCTIELPGVNSDSTQRFYREVFAEMDRARIPFTLHWGQEGDYSPARLRAMYGDALKEWVDARNRLLPDPVQRYMFTNDFLKRCGLSEAPILTGGGVIA